MFSSNRASEFVVTHVQYPNSKGPNICRCMDLKLQGVQPCTFYLQKGHCKFGRACKFDHPIIGTTVRYSPSALSLTNVPVASLYALGSSRGIPSTGNTSASSVGLIYYSQMSSLSLSDVHRSTQGSPTSSITSRSTRLRGKVRRSI